MRCPFCGHDETQVKDSRPSEDNSAIRRRRQCPACGARFTTFERVQLRELMVIKKDESRVVFDREKLVRSISISCRKRPVKPDQIELITNSIQRRLESSGESEIPSKVIGELVMDALKELDRVAYLRFASVYKDFQETDDFNSVVTKNDKIAKLAIIEALEIIENGKVSAQKNDKRKSTYNTIPSVRQAWIFRKRIINKFI